MEHTCQSEYGSLQSVVIKRAKDALVNSKKIQAEWKQLNYLAAPDYDKAVEEYALFESMITSRGASVIALPPDEYLSLDAIYCRDASIATDRGMIICNMGKPQRSKEPHAEMQAFLKEGIPILGTIQAPGTIEGGDVAWLDQKTLAVGQSYRTNESGIEQLSALLSPQQIEIIKVPLPHYKGPADVFHLMSILSPVDRNLAVVYAPLMPIVFRNALLNRGFDLVEVPDEEFESMGCNVLAIAPRVCLMVKGNPITRSRLEKSGCEVLEYAGAEISVKGGGGPTCLTRPIWRTL